MKRNILKAPLKYLLFALVMLLFHFTIQAQNKHNDKLEANAQIKAIYIYNFTKYIEWPNQFSLTEFTIGILGNNEPLKKALDKMAAVKMVNNLHFKVKIFNDIESITPTQLLYMNGEDGFNQERLFNKIKGQGTLLVA